jgi:hypothetical protein
VQHVRDTDGVVVAFMEENYHRGTRRALDMAEKLDVPTIEMYFTPKGKWTGILNAPDKYMKENT